MNLVKTLFSYNFDQERTCMHSYIVHANLYACTAVVLHAQLVHANLYACTAVVLQAQLVHMLIYMHAQL